MSGKGSGATAALKAGDVIPYSFTIRYKEPVPSGFAAQFLQKVEDLCKKHPTSPKGQALPGVTSKYTAVFQGFAGQFHPDVIGEIKKEKQVEVIPDGVVDLCGWGPYIDQGTENWALASISSDPNAKQSVNLKDPNRKFTYHRSELGGKGITIYCLDGGCNLVVGETDDTPDRVKEDKAEPSVVVLTNAELLQDAFASGRIHGTNVAIAAAGKTLGTAPKATVRNYRVINKGSPVPAASTVVEALEDILQNEKNPHLSVINCSLGSKFDVDNPSGRSPMRLAIAQAIAKGFLVVAAAGNDKQEIVAQSGNNDADPKTVYPASLPGVLAIGAVDQDHAQTKFSNFGQPVKLWAPGTMIPKYDFVPGLYQGTSFAAPYVSGIAACILAEKHRDEPAARMTPDQVKKQLLDWGQKFPNAPTLLHNGRK